MSDLCSSCGQFEEDLKRCSGCKTVFYCSKSCQRNAWPNHKATCKLLQKQAESETTQQPPGSTKSGTSAKTGKKEGQKMRPLMVVDNTTGSIRPVNQPLLCDMETTQSEASRPRPKELSRLVKKLSSSLPHQKFFPQTGGKLFSFITDLRNIQAEWAVVTSSLPDLDNTILIAKIIQMDVWAIRHGIRIMGEENKLPVMTHFYVKDDSPFPFFKWSDLRPGNYICIQGPVIHTFMDGQVGFRIDHAWQVRILTASGEFTSG